MDTVQHHIFRSDSLQEERDERYELLVRGIESIEDYAIFNLDAKGFIQNWNHGARRIKGYFPHEVIGKHFSLFYPKEEQEKFLPHHKLEIAADLGRFEEEGWRVRKNGEKFWANVVLTAMKNAEGKLLGFTKVTRDLTNVRETEEKFRKSEARNHELEDSLRMKDEFISVASHELRTPLTRILLRLQMMKRNGEGMNEKVLKGLNECEEASKDLSELMEKLVDVTRLRLGKLELKRTKTNITNIILDVISNFKDEIRLSGNHVSFNHEGDVIGYWDQNRLEQLFSNLLSNAIKYTQGQPVKMELKLKGEFVHFIISDEGPGIPYNLQPKLFERFERAVDSKKISGLGLGLYISKQIVDAHKGEISLESIPGEGTTFEVVLPLKKDSKKRPV